MFDAPSDRYASGQTLQVAGCPVRLMVNPRARRVSLRLDAARLARGLTIRRTGQPATCRVWPEA